MTGTMAVLVASWGLGYEPPVTPPTPDDPAALRRELADLRGQASRLTDRIEAMERRLAPPTRAHAEVAWDRLGVKLRGTPPPPVTDLDDRFRGGLEVTAVRPGGAAAAAKIRAGDVLIRLGEWETSCPEHVTFVLDQLATDRTSADRFEVRFVVVRDGRVVEGKLSLDRPPAPAVRGPGGPKGVAAEDVAVKIRGEWKVVSATTGGRSVDVPAGLRAVITANSVRMECVVGTGDRVLFHAREEAWSYETDLLARPNELDLVTLVEPGGRRITPAIFALNGDELKLCVGEGRERPRRFESKSGDDAVLWVLQRIPPEPYPVPPG